MIREHEETYNENNIRDFIDVYLQEIKKQNNNKVDSSFSGPFSFYSYLIIIK